MKNKFLFSLLSLVGVVAIVVGILLPVWNVVVLGEVGDGLGLFEDLGAPVFALAFGEGYNALWATLTMVGALVALASLVLYALVALLQHARIVKGCAGLLKILAWIAVIGFVLVLAFGLVYTITSDASTTIAGTTLASGMKFAVGYWLILIGSGIGAFFALLGAKSK